jgi:hypothetical protein
MMNSNSMNIREHMMVHAKGGGSMDGVAGDHVGTVDKVEGDMIKLTKNDSPDGFHHYIPLAWVERVEENTVHLSRDAESVMREWQSENREDMSQTQSVTADEMMPRTNDR